MTISESTTIEYSGVTPPQPQETLCPCCRGRGVLPGRWELCRKRIVNININSDCRYCQYLSECFSIAEEMCLNCRGFGVISENGEEEDGE